MLQTLPITGSLSRSRSRESWPLITFQRVAAIVAAKEFVGGEVKTRVRVRADDERRVPIPTQRIFAATGLRLNAHAFAGALVETHEPAVLQLGIDGVRIFRIDLTAKTVAAVGHEPVGVGDAGSAARARWTAETEVVLRAAVDVVERRRVVGRDVVELRDRQVAV